MYDDKKNNLVYLLLLAALIFVTSLVAGDFGIDNSLKLNKTGDRADTSFYLNNSFNNSRYFFTPSTGYINMSSNNSNTFAYMTLRPNFNTYSQYNSSGLQFQARITVASYPTQFTLEAKDLITGLGTISQINVLSESLTIDGTNRRIHNATTLVINSNVTLTNFTGTGNAHLCINASGQIYRGSLTSC